MSVGNGVAVGVGEGSGVQVGSGVHVGTVGAGGDVGSGVQVGEVGQGTVVGVATIICGDCESGDVSASQATRLRDRAIPRIDSRDRMVVASVICKVGTSLRKGRWHFAVVANSRRKARKEARWPCHACEAIRRVAVGGL